MNKKNFWIVFANIDKKQLITMKYYRVLILTVETESLSRKNTSFDRSREGAVDSISSPFNVNTHRYCKELIPFNQVICASHFTFSKP